MKGVDPGGVLLGVFISNVNRKWVILRVHRETKNIHVTLCTYKRNYHNWAPRNKESQFPFSKKTCRRGLHKRDTNDPWPTAQRNCRPFTSISITKVVTVRVKRTPVPTWASILYQPFSILTPAQRASLTVFLTVRRCIMVVRLRLGSGSRDFSNSNDASLWWVSTISAS